MKSVVLEAGDPERLEAGLQSRMGGGRRGQEEQEVSTFKTISGLFSVLDDPTGKHILSLKSGLNKFT